MAEESQKTEQKPIRDNPVERLINLINPGLAGGKDDFA